MSTSTKRPKAEPPAEENALPPAGASDEPVVPAAGRYSVRRRRAHDGVLFGRQNEHLIATQVPAEVRDEWVRLGHVTFVPAEPAAPDTAPPAAQNPE
jgi:hypothetical protein